MALRLHDSLSRELRPLTPADGRTLRMYCCGPTVYGPAHIGNFRTFVLQDVLRRVLELAGRDGGWTVRHVRNLTDVDDKTIRRTREENRPLRAITTQWTEKFQADCRALNCLPPHEEPRATDFIPAQVTMIETLLARGAAYVAPDGSVYFKIDAFPEYGNLSRVRERELMTGAPRRASAAAADEYERESVADFALWKAWKPEDGEVKWPGPAGAAAGRPGWHIECSAMVQALLGDTIDLHAGGVDLLFPHHENEIAQSGACTGQPLARHWWHTEHLLVDGRKMSKSLGNLYTLDELVGKGFSPQAVRYALLAGHPRKQLNFTLESLHAAEKALQTLRSLRASRATGGEAAEDPLAPVFAALEDDLNTPAALGALFATAHRDGAPLDRASFDRVLFAFGFDLDAAAPSLAVPAEVNRLAETRWAARRARDFATADRLRAELAAAGWSMLDGKDGYKLEPLKK